MIYIHVEIMHLPVLYEKKYIACDNVSLHKQENSTNISMNVVMPTAQLSIYTTRVRAYNRSS